jgi:predicted DNA-binding transcriptional regulator YafY
VSPTAGRLVAETATSCLLTTGSGSLDELALYVALKGFDFEVLEPPQLASHLEALGRRCQRAAAGRRRRGPRTR